MDTIIILLLLLWLRKRREMNNKKKTRILRFKTRPVFRNRNLLGEMNLMREIYAEDEELFFKSFRMSARQFDYLLSNLEPSISPKYHQHDSISARQRLAITLRYTSMSLCFSMSSAKH